MAVGGIFNHQPPPNISNADLARSAAKGQQNVLSDLLAAIKDLKDDVQGRVKKKTDEPEDPRLRTRSEKEDAPEDLHTRVQFQDQSASGTKMAKNKDLPPGLTEEDIAAEFAGILSEDDIKKKKRKEKTSFESKLERFAALEETLKDIEPSDPHQKEVFEKFRDNVARMQNLKSMFNRLSFVEQELEDRQKGGGA